MRTLIFSILVLFTLLRYGFSAGLDTDPAFSNFNKAVSLYNRGNLEEALHLLEKSLKLYPGFLQAHLLCARVYSRLKRYDLAVGEYKKVLELYPSFFIGHLEIGYLYDSLNKLELAKKHLKRALQINPLSKDAMLAFIGF